MPDEFDPIPTEFTEQDLAPPDSGDLRSFTPVIEELTADLDLLTNRLDQQLRQRRSSLEAAEIEELGVTERLAPLVYADVLSPEDAVDYLEALVRLKAIRLDLVDTERAIGIIHLDTPVDPLDTYQADGITATVDSREQFS